MSDFIIRSARSGDEAAIHEAHMRSIREICVKDHGENEIKGWGNRPLGNRWIDAIKADHVWVVESNGRIFGHAYIRIFEENVEKRAHVHGLYLTPEVLGKGFGRKLGRLMLDTAKNAGVSLVTLESTITAHEFYKGLGFTDSEPMNTMEIAGYPVRYFPMALRFD
jgi:putative acetyltransferase